MNAAISFITYITLAGKPPTISLSGAVEKFDGSVRIWDDSERSHVHGVKLHGRCSRLQ